MKLTDSQYKFFHLELRQYSGKKRDFLIGSFPIQAAIWNLTC